MLGGESMVKRFHQCPLELDQQRLTLTVHGLATGTLTHPSLMQYSLISALLCH